MKPLTSIIMAACQQGDWVRRTVPQAIASMGDWPHEIIVVDDQSTDGCCHNLPKDVLVARTDERLGVSGARRFGVKRARGDILLFSDPHCEYPEGALRQMVKDATRKRAVIQVCTTCPPHEKRARWGSRLITSERGLRTKRQYGGPAAHPALIGTIYAVDRKLYDFLGGWPHLPGIWGYSEQALSLMCWFAGVPIWTQSSFTCTHHHYHPGGKFSYHVSTADQATNGHYMHAAFFPKTYDVYWREVLCSKFGDSPAHVECLQTDQFKRFRWHIKKRSVKTEQEFFDQVLQRPLPTASDPKYVKQQNRRSNPHEYKSVRLRVKKELHWLCKNLPGCLRGRRVLDLGTRDGWALERLKQLGARGVEGVELVPEVAAYARSKGRPVRCGDMQCLPDTPGTFDIITALHSLEHVPNPDKAIGEMARIVKAGGWVYIVVPQEPEPQGNPTHNHNYRDENDLIAQICGHARLDPSTIKTDLKVMPESKKGNKEIRLLVKAK